MNSTMTRQSHAIYVITKHGLEIAKRLLVGLPEADLYVSHRFIDQAPPGSKLLSLPMEPTLRETFQLYDCHTHIISVGAVVRMIAPLLVNKKVDPAIICVDDKANFSVCVLSGHVGRGNFFTQRVADILGNTAVITTASDVTGTLTVDILGRDLGWSLADMDRNVTRGCAAVVNQTQVMFVQEAGEPEWWPLNKPLPPGVQYGQSLDSVDPSAFEILLIASDRSDIHKTHPHHFSNSVIYHPKSLILGLGCDRDTPLEIVERGILKVLSNSNLALKSVKAIASVERKADEPAFLQLSQKYGWPLLTYSAEELEATQGIANPSEMVMKHVGTPSVSEAAALKAAGAPDLLVQKVKYREGESKNLTVAIARIPYAGRAEPATILRPMELT